MSVALVAGCVLGGPLLLGATPPSVGAMLQLAAAGAITCWALASSRPTALLLAPFVVAAPALLQLLPLPPGLLRAISPWAAAIWSSVSRAGDSAWHPVSVDPAATLAAAGWLFLAFGVAVVVADLARDRRHRRVLLAAISASALVTWSLGVAFPRSEDHLLLGFFDLRGFDKGPAWWWRTAVVRPEQSAGFSGTEWVTAGGARYPVPYRGIGDGMGSYVVSNHFAAGLYLTLPTLLGVLLSGLRRRLPSAIGLALAAALFAWAAWTVGVVGGSRGGALATVAGGLVFLAFE
ncbi:MAG: hypothetical protein ACKO2K_07555, partial [Alphaproteobacteria bacterium]